MIFIFDFLKQNPTKCRLVDPCYGWRVVVCRPWVYMSLFVHLGSSDLRKVHSYNFGLGCDSVFVIICRSYRS